MITVLTGFLFSIQNPVFAQEDHLTRKVNLEQTEISFSQLRLKVETLLGLNFIFNSSLVKVDAKIQLPSTEPTLKQLLDSLSKSQNITYTLKGKTILLNKKKASKKSLKNGLNGLNGHIKDAFTGEILIGATVYIKALVRGTLSNNYGYYSLTVPEGTYLVQVSYVGYETFSQQIIIKGNVSKEIALSSTVLDEVIVVSGLQPEDILTAPEMGVTTISEVQLKNQPSLLGEPDLIRVLLNAPGVNNIGEGSSGFNVRGGQIDQNLILLDEAPIYNSSHLLGFFSVFNSDAIKTSKLYKGIPARYGGRASSVLDIHQKDGKNHLGGSINVGAIIERASIEGPTVKDKGSFLIAGRLFNPLLSLLAAGAGDSGDESSVGFYDLNAKISHTFSKRNKLFLSVYSSRDQFIIELSQDEFSALKWTNQTSTLRWNKIFNPRLFSNTTGLYSTYNYQVKERLGGVSGTWKSRISNFTLKSDFQYFPSANYTLEFGAQANFTRIIPSDIMGNIGSLNIASSERQVSEVQRGLENSVYISLESQLTKKLLIQSGLRYTLFGLLGAGTVNTYAPDEPLSATSITGKRKFVRGEWITNYSGLEPRLLLSYQLSARVAIKANYQRLNQYLQLISNTSSTSPLDIWKLSDKYVKPLTTDMYSMGFYWANNESGVQVATEGYYKTLDNFVEYKNGANLYGSPHIETELLSGDGKAYGFEISLLKTSKKTNVSLAYTYSRTIRNVRGDFREETINGGRDYPSNFDQPHILSLSLHHQFSEKWDVNAFFTYKTGRPITRPGSRYVLNQIEGDLSDFIDSSSEPVVIYEYSERNDYRIPDFHRLDLSCGFTPMSKGKKKSKWSFGIYNLYGRKNAFSIAFITSNATSDYKPSAKKISLIGIPVPYISYSLKI